MPKYKTHSETEEITEFDSFESAKAFVSLNPTVIRMTFEPFPHNIINLIKDDTGNWVNETRKDVKCQSCIDRELEPNTAIGIWKGQPICDSCLSPLIENKIDTGIDEVLLPSPNTEEHLEKLEAFVDGWQLKKDEVLANHEDFFNHKAIAVVNLSPSDLEARIDKWKSLFYGIRAHTERLQDLIDRVKAKERAEKRGEIIEGDLKEKNKKVLSKKLIEPSEIKEAEIKKLAKALGVDIETLRKSMQDARNKELGLDETKLKPNISKTKEVLEELKEDIRASTPSKKCNLCGKIDCRHLLKMKENSKEN